MHPSLELLFGHLSGGLLWLSAAGHVRFANAMATQLTGFKAGHDLPDGTLRNAVAAIGSGRHPHPIEMEYLPPAGEQRLLHAQAAPALSAGDAFVFLDEAAPHGEPLALDNLMTVIRTDLTAPLERLERCLVALRQGQHNEEAVDDAVKQSGGIVDTLQRLVDLSTLWSSDSLLATDRLAVWSLLQQAWAHALPFAEQRRIVAKVDELMALVDVLEAYHVASNATAANLLAALVAEFTSTAHPHKKLLRSGPTASNRSRVASN